MNQVSWNCISGCLIEKLWAMSTHVPRMEIDMSVWFPCDGSHPHCKTFHTLQRRWKWCHKYTLSSGNSLDHLLCLYFFCSYLLYTEFHVMRQETPESGYSTIENKWCTSVLDFIIGGTQESIKGSQRHNLMVTFSCAQSFFLSLEWAKNMNMVNDWTQHGRCCSDSYILFLHSSVRRVSSSSVVRHLHMESPYSALIANSRLIFFFIFWGWGWGGEQVLGSCWSQAV